MVYGLDKQRVYPTVDHTTCARVLRRWLAGLSPISAAQGLEVGSAGVCDGGGPSEVDPRERALIDVGDVCVPTAALTCAWLLLTQLQSYVCGG